MQKTILYVEDHPPARFLMSAIVSDLTPFRLVTVGSGGEARAAAANEHPDLYLLDLDLPDTDGAALAEMLNGIHPAPVIIVSAYAESIRSERFPAVVTDYLAKPLDPDHVAETLKRALGG